MADSELSDALEEALGTGIMRMDPLSGGDVARSYRVDLSDGIRVFAKTKEGAPPGFFTTEATGLAWLGERTSLGIPAVRAVSDGGAGEGPLQSGEHDSGEHESGKPSPNYLVLEWIEEGDRGGGTEAELGHGLAELHLGGFECFGRPDRRTTGSRGLPNEPCLSWSEFYAEQRLLPLARLSHDCAALPDSTISQIEALAGRLDTIGVPYEPPALLHGDLWAGNRLVGDSGRNWLIDPAAHGGHREFDIAMMRLFGGFDEACFAAYHEHYPLAPGWQDRVSLHQIAPLVVHAIKFGGSYVSAAVTAVAKYS
jgi:fructosamine-3-kinase